jgi:hypothetical protein
MKSIYLLGLQTWYIHQHQHILCGHLIHGHWDTDIYNHLHDWYKVDHVHSRVLILHIHQYLETEFKYKRLLKH